MKASSFIQNLLSYRDNPRVIATARQVLADHGVPEALKHPIKSQELESWFEREALKRLMALPKGLDPARRKDLLEAPNRYPDGSMELIAAEELCQMSQFYGSTKDLIDRIRHGVELLCSNTVCQDLGTVVRGVPSGGASSRAAKWVHMNADLAKQFGFNETTPRPLYRVENKTLLQQTLNLSRHIARKIGRIFPNIVMTNSENIDQVLASVRSDWSDYQPPELENTIFFNQIVLPRIRVEDHKIIRDRLYPAGHGDFPYLLAKYHVAHALKKTGIKYLVFSNADEWLWQADPVMVSIAQGFFDKGQHMIIIGTRNTNNQFGGGFVRKADGTQSLVETPRLPWDIVKKGIAPIALNTTFYLIDLDYLAEHEELLLEVNKSLVIKEVPATLAGRASPDRDGMEQIIGVDSWAGDAFASALNPVFIEWPRLNFLGIKDGGFIVGRDPRPELGGRSYSQYVHESVREYPALMSRLIDGDKTAARFLFDNHYSYLAEKTAVK